MDYTQTLLVQVAAADVEEALRPEGLLAELDGHGAHLQQQAGFQGVRVSHSINVDGNMQVAVETRWQDRASLEEYGAREPNLQSIVAKYQDVIIAGSLEVVDGESPAPERREGPATVHERLVLPLLVPLGIFFFGVLVIYGLSRVYLDVPNEVSTPLALAIASGILIVSWYLASNPNVPRWQIGGIALLAAGLLLGGGIFAAVHEEEEGSEASVEGVAAAESPVASPAPGAAASPAPGGAPEGALTIAMVPTIAFDKTELRAAAGTEITVAFENQDTGIPHNWAIYTDSTASSPIAGANEHICPAPCSGSVTFGPLDAGEYFFRCDVHPLQMIGTLIVE